MVKLPPPFWALAYTLIAVGVSYLMGWPRVSGLPLVWPGVVLMVLGISLSVTAAMLFRREGTEINPTSPANRKLVTSGPFRLTRNPMYLGLVLVTSGIALWVSAWPMFLAPIAIFATANWVHIPFE
jgi:protein-S-isoprenylcysteine O-methyltransferase Ste14